MTTNAILATEAQTSMQPAQTNPTRPPQVNLADDERWNAVTRRDANRDGEFVFAVSTTGVYCRPSCPARRPRRA